MSCETLIAGAEAVRKQSAFLSRSNTDLEDALDAEIEVSRWTNGLTNYSSARTLYEELWD